MSQYTRVQKVLAGTPSALALHEIHEAIRIQFGVLDSEAAISARIREIRHAVDVSGSGFIHTERVEGKAYLRYQLIESSAGKPQGLFAH